MKVKFEIENGSEKVLKIEDEFINNYEIAKSKAVSLFLEYSYIKQKIQVGTYFIDNVSLGDIVMIDNSLYIIENITITIVKGAVKMSILGFRYEL